MSAPDAGLKRLDFACLLPGVPKYAPADERIQSWMCHPDYPFTFIAVERDRMNKSEFWCDECKKVGKLTSDLGNLIRHVAARHPSVYRNSPSPSPIMGTVPPWSGLTCWSRLSCSWMPVAFRESADWMAGEVIISVRRSLKGLSYIGDLRVWWCERDLAHFSQRISVGWAREKPIGLVNHTMILWFINFVRCKKTLCALYNIDIAIFV
jgi:hypothetical protein